MSQLKGGKLNNLLTHWPRGAVYTSSWLNQHGFTSDRIADYKKSHWLYTIGDNAMAKSGDKVDWKGGLYALQKQLDLPIHVGGKTALSLLGYSHYVAPKQTLVTLYSPPGIRLPVWFKKYDWSTEFELVTTNLFPAKKSSGFQDYESGEFTITISSPERAMMETLHLVPQEQSLDEAKYLMENLTTLRPSLVQTLLKDCHSIKVRRLFMFLAEECNQPWVKKLNLSEIDFGKGNRVIVKEGYLDPKYKITVPKDFKVQEIRNENER
ncbi:MAG: type IV toxin-antitoxin system AbiEi family antitoxin [Deltaproteobacteria bacterium]|nr:MAG: type IV toxin-antitoxin system AbiEi family antitoxin [Deltaproteobacteria bacterium]